MAWKDEIRKEDKVGLIGITREKLREIESELNSLSVEQLEKLYDYIVDALDMIE